MSNLWDPDQPATKSNNCMITEVEIFCKGKKLNKYLSRSLFQTVLQIYNTQKQHCSIKTGCSYKFRKIHKKIPVPKPLFKWSCRPQAWNFIKKETLTEVFSCEFAKFVRTSFCLLIYLIIHSFIYLLIHFFSDLFSLLFLTFILPIYHFLSPLS